MSAWAGRPASAASRLVNNQSRLGPASAPRTNDERSSMSRRRTSALPSDSAARLVELLRQHRVVQAGERFERGDAWTETGLVFTSSIGTPLEPRNVNRRFDQLREKAGLPWLRLHDLRHAFASMLFSEGVPARTVMELLGHSTIQLTMNTYTHVMPETQRDAVGRLDHLFTGDRPTDEEDDNADEAGGPDPTDTDTDTDQQ
nr:site-specific integrase [Candidatus Protofrankia datiscae]